MVTARLVILTEDSGKDSRSVIETVVRKMLGLILPGVRLDRLDFLPRQAAEEEAMRGNVWKTDGRNPIERERQIRLRRYLTRRLCEPNTYVIFHVDGDRPWAEREKSENIEKFKKLVRIPLLQIRESPPRIANARQGQAPESAHSLRMERLFLLCPFRSIEAWLYQNLERAIAICKREHAGRHVSALRDWEEKRHELDELGRPEAAFCLGKAHNHELAIHGFPARLAYDVQKSFAASVDGMKSCETLCAALEMTLRT